MIAANSMIESVTIRYEKAERGLSDEKDALEIAEKKIVLLQHASDEIEGEHEKVMVCLCLCQCQCQCLSLCLSLSLRLGFFDV